MKFQGTTGLNRRHQRCKDLRCRSSYDFPILQFCSCIMQAGMHSSLQDPAVQMRMQMDFPSHVFSLCTFRCPDQYIHL